MADAETILEFRRMINEPGQDPYTDVMLSDLIDAASDLRTLASTIWTEKAATYSALVDIKEGNSDRKLSQLQRQALAMASSFGSDTSGEPNVPARVRTRQIVRP